MHARKSVTIPPLWVQGTGSYGDPASSRAIVAKSYPISRLRPLERPMITTTSTTTPAATALLDAVGDTPLLRLRAIDAEIAPVEIWAKAEHLNPGRSVKDRPALRMIRDGERTGALTHNRAILDATSGNTGIAHA